MACIGVSCCWLLLPQAEQPQQQWAGQAGQAAFAVGAALLAVLADLALGKGGGKQSQCLPQLPASTCQGQRQHRCCCLRASALEGHRDPAQGVSIRWACLEGLAGGNEVSRSRSFYSMPTKWRLKLAQDAGNHFLAWALLHLHPICAATSHAKERGCDSPWACLVEGKAPYGSWWLNLTVKGI